VERTRVPALSYFFPAHNEAENIEGLVAEALDVLPGLAERFEIICVNDGSRDGTGEIADRLAAEHDDVEVIHRAVKEGLGPAYIAGFERALAGGAELVIAMDSDFSHEPSYLPRLLRAAESADLVLGSRYIPGGGVTEWGKLRRAISRGGSSYARVLLGVDIRDLTGGFKCYRREVLEGIELETLSSKGYAFQVETTYRAIRAGFRVVEIPIVFHDRREGSSKMNRGIVAEAAWRVPAMRMRREGRRR
jgi:dolichol-phosphate mannosyltransferase